MPRFLEGLRQYYLSLDEGSPARRLLRLVRTLLLLGFRVRCPFCHTGFRQMLPWRNPNTVAEDLQIIGAMSVEDYRCPRCDSIDRERHLWLYLRYCGGPPYQGLAEPRCRVLHLAPEGNLKRCLAALPGVEYVSADLFAAGYTPDTYGRDTLPTDLTALPFKEEAFDLVIVSHVLEHVAHDLRALSELRRVCRAGGKVLVMVPVSAILPRTFEDPAATDPAARARVFGQADHLRVYGTDFAQTLGEAGFRVETFSLSDLRGGLYARLFAVNPREQIFVARK